MESESQIIREKKILLDERVAALLDVSITVILRKVRNNPDRFPKIFMFQLTQKETKKIFGQVTKRRKIYAFTWGGVILLAGLINTQRAIDIHLQIIRFYGNGILNKIF